MDEEHGEDFGDGPPRELNEVERAWLAAVIDGEGSIFINKLVRGPAACSRRGFVYVPAISLGSSNEWFERKVRETIGKGSVSFIEEKRLDWKDKWYYRGSTSVLRGLLPQLLPYLLIKRQVCERMLQYLAFVDSNPINGPMGIPRGYYENLDSLYSAVKESNEKGKDVPNELLTAMLQEPKSWKNRGRGGWLAAVIDGEGSVFCRKLLTLHTGEASSIVLKWKSAIRIGPF